MITGAATLGAAVTGTATLIVTAPSMVRDKLRRLARRYQRRDKEIIKDADKEIGSLVAQAARGVVTLVRC